MDTLSPHLEDVKRQLLTSLQARVTAHPDTEPRSFVDRLIAARTESLTDEDRRRVTEAALADWNGLGPLEPLLRDPDVSDVQVNGPGRVFVVKRGSREETAVRFRDREHLVGVLSYLLSRAGRRMDETATVIEVRLPDGGSLRAVMPPLAADGPALTVRRFDATRLALEDLLNFRMLTPEMAMFFEASVKARATVLISGGTRTGKTSLLHVLTNFISSDEVVCALGDVRELRLPLENVYHLETPPETADSVRPEALVRVALDLRADRLVLGECRGGEVREFLRAVSSGLNGSLTTVRAGSPLDALYMLEKLALAAEIRAAPAEARQQIARGIQVVAHLDLLQGGLRRVTAIAEVQLLENQQLATQDLFRYRQLGVDPSGRAFGHFEATGAVSQLRERFETAGIRLPSTMFTPHVMLRDGPGTER